VNAKWTLGFNGNNLTYGIDTTTANFVMPIRDISGFEPPENSAVASYNLTNCSADTSLRVLCMTGISSIRFWFKPPF